MDVQRQDAGGGNDLTVAPAGPEECYSPPSSHPQDQDDG
jgi:hypothetical protein